MRLPACASLTCSIGRYVSNSSAGWKRCCGRIRPASIPRWISTRATDAAASIEDLRRGSGLAEDQVARRVLDLADPGCPVTTMRMNGRSHVGTYLIGEKRGELAPVIGCRESLRFRALHWTYRHHSPVYFAGLVFLLRTHWSLCSCCWDCTAGRPGIQLLIAALLLIPASQLSLEVMNYLVMRLLPPRTLPKMDYRVSGIPDACRTLVVVPMMLADLETIQDEAEKLEIRYLANKEDNLLFGLFSDYMDAPQLHCEADETPAPDREELHRGPQPALRRRSVLPLSSGANVERIRAEIHRLGTEAGKAGRTQRPDRRHAAARGRRAWSTSAIRINSSDVRFVITLDSDTQLPHDTARRLIETLAHPLNQPRFDGEGRVQAGYTIIQPRVSPSLPSTSGSPFSRLFSDPVGIDPYTNAVSDVNQDLTGEGSYHGKGIYDVRAFSRVLSGRFPEALAPQPRS